MPLQTVKYFQSHSFEKNHSQMRTLSSGSFGGTTLSFGLFVLMLQVSYEHLSFEAAIGI